MTTFLKLNFINNITGWDKLYSTHSVLDKSELNNDLHDVLLVNDSVYAYYKGEWVYIAQIANNKKTFAIKTLSFVKIFMELEQKYIKDGFPPQRAEGDIIFKDGKIFIFDGQNWQLIIIYKFTEEVPPEEEPPPDEGSNFIGLTEAQIIVLINNRFEILIKPTLAEIKSLKERVKLLEKKTSTIERNVTELTTQLNGKADLVNGKVKPEQLPESFNQVEYGYYINNNFYNRATPSEADKIERRTKTLYVDLLTFAIYSFSNNSYHLSSSTLGLGTTSTTAFRGSEGLELRNAINTINTTLTKKADLVQGVVPKSQLPEMGQDNIVMGYLSNNNFYKNAPYSSSTLIAPDTSNKIIYIDLSTDNIYRYNGTLYKKISSSLSLGETNTTAFAGNRGKNLETAMTKKADLGSDNKVLPSQLPTFDGDDVVEGYYFNGKFYNDSDHASNHLITGSVSKMYIDLSTNKTYRYSTTNNGTYIRLDATEIGTTTGTAFDGKEGSDLKTKVNTLETSLNSKADLVGGYLKEDQVPSIAKNLFVGYLISGNFYKTNSTSGTVITKSANAVYIDKNTHLMYYVDNNTYASLSNSLSLGVTSSTAFYGDRGLALETNYTNLVNNVLPTKADLVNGKVPTSQLPSFDGDDVVDGYFYNNDFFVEAAHTTAIEGAASKIYVDLGALKLYRYDSSTSKFVEVSVGLKTGTSANTAYRGDLGNQLNTRVGNLETELQNATAILTQIAGIV